MSDIVRSRRQLGACFHAMLAVIFFVTACSRKATAQVHDETLKERFLREAPTSWHEYTCRAENLQGSYRGSSRYSLNGMTDQSSAEYKKNGSGALLVYSAERVLNGKKSCTEEVYAFNGRYSFKLQRKSQSAPWVLVGLGDGGKNGIPEQSARRFENHRNAVLEPFRLFNQPLVEVVKRPYFRILNCRNVPNGRDELVEVTFDYAHKLEADSMFQGGKLLLDPSRYWCLRGYELQGKTTGATGPMTYEVSEVGDPVGTLPVVRRTHTVFDWTFDKPIGKNGDTKSNQEWHLEFNLREPSVLPGDDEFTLSHFGLPEPPGLEATRSTSWFVLAGAAGVLCLILSGFLLWLKRRVMVAGQG